MATRVPIQSAQTSFYQTLFTIGQKTQYIYFFANVNERTNTSLEPSQVNSRGVLLLIKRSHCNGSDKYSSLQHNLP